MRLDPTGGATAAKAWQSPVFAWVERAATLGAIIGGLVLMAMTALTCISVVQRLIVDRPVPGMFELVELMTGIAVMSFFPYTHVIRGNIVAEFFTQNAPERLQAALDVVAELAFAAIAGFLLIRVGAGLLESFESLNRTFVLNLPEWAFYVPATLWLVLLVAVAIAIAVDGMMRLLR